MDKREQVREMLFKRYNGVIEITEAMLDAVMDGLQHAEGKA